jgi:hypothetical protein
MLLGQRAGPTLRSPRFSRIMNLRSSLKSEEVLKRMQLHSDGYMSSFQDFSRMGGVNRLVERRSVVGDQYYKTKRCLAIATSPEFLLPKDTTFR